MPRIVTAAPRHTSHSSFASLALGSWLIVIALFGGYVVLTSGRFQRAHAVRCPSCASSLTRLCVDLDPEEREGPLPDELHCPSCGTLVAKVSNREHR